MNLSRLKRNSVRRKVEPSRYSGKHLKKNQYSKINIIISPIWLRETWIISCKAESMTIKVQELAAEEANSDTRSQGFSLCSK